MNASVNEHRIVTHLRRTVALFSLILLASTWRLWTPQTVFPQIPLWRAAGRLPAWVDWTGFGAMLLAMAIVLIAHSSNRWWRFGCAAFVGGFAVMMLVDQHRLQPWAYQFALIAAVLALVPDRRAMSLIRLLTVGIYFHSALSKLDDSFFESHGQYLVGGLTDVLGLEFEKWSPSLRRCFAALLPIGELVVAVGLCFRRTRRATLVGAISMHALLIVALGPWSLDHEPGVLFWNAYFIVQDVLLFGRFTDSTLPAERIESATSRWPVTTARAVVGLAILLPFLEPFGLFDAWPSWAVYASRPARVRILIDSDATDRLPAELTPYLQEARFSDLKCPVRVDRWSLETTKAPTYPNPRFDLGVALAIAEKARLKPEIHVEIESAANRWNGKRTVRKLSGLPQIRGEAERYWLNALPRGNRNEQR